mgnify:CR=1 FL=1
MVYLARKGGEVIHHTDLEAMKSMDGIDKAEMEISDEEFEAAGCLARIIGDEIFIGKTDAEKKRDDAEVRIRFLKTKLTETDYIAAKIAEGSATADEYAEKIAERQAWRAEINELEKLTA